jgi:hypothetical protein
LNSQLDNSLGDSDQYRKQPSVAHNEVKVHQEIGGEGHIVSGTGNVYLTKTLSPDNYWKLISKTPQWLLLLGFAPFFYRWNKEVFSGEMKPMMIFEFMLISVTLILGLLWLLSSEHELSILEHHLGKSLKQRKFSPRIISYSIPIFMIILSVSANRIYIYAFIYWIYISVDVFGRKIAADIIYDAVKDVCTHGGSNKAIDKIYSYYIKNHFELRGYITGSIFLVVFLVGILSENLIDKSILPHMFLLERKFGVIEILYLTATSSIVLSEVVIWCWRKEMYTYISEYDNA